MVGLNIPSVACEHHHILFEKMDAVADRSEMLPLVRDPDESYYLRQEGDSLLLGMYENRAVPWYPKGVPWDYAQRELPTDLDRILPYVEACIHRVPIMEHAGMKHVTCGPITYTPNADPLVGPAFPLRNFWLCCGYSFGITQAGGIGKYLVEWIVDGYPSTDLWPVDPRRYGEYASHQYLLDKVADTYPRIYDIPFPNQERDAGRPVKTTPIYPRLKAANAAFGEMYGWERPNWFAPQGATAKDVDSWRRTNWHDPVGREVKAVNEGVGVLDMSGFAKFLVSGPGAEAYLDRLSCNKVPTQIGRIAIFPTLTDKGTFLCDMTVTKLADDQFVIVSAAMATDHDHHQLLLTLPDDGSVTLEDVTTEIGCLVVAGPKSRDVLAKLTEADLSNQGFPFATMRRIEVAGVPVQANRLNFVGELGWELFQKIEQQLPLYDAIMEAGQEFGIVNFGIRAMNSMRLEKGYCTWKGELNTLHTPWEAGLGWQVKLDKGDFIGKDALIEQKEQGVPQKLVLMAVEADNADGYGYNGVYKDGRYVGMTSSGGYGWRVDKSLCMAYIEPELAEVGTRLEVEILDQRHSALVVPIPFYDPKNERMKA
jgi:dimethylglycine dehydrogenase